MRRPAASAEVIPIRVRRQDPHVSKLALAILVQAFRDAFSSSASVREWKRDSLAWFQSHDNDPGSLDWVCSILHIEPDLIRAWISSQQVAESEVTRIVRRLRGLKLS